MSIARSVLLLDPTTGDLATANGRLVIATGSEAVLQGIKTRLSFFRGEWPFDETVGVPYFPSETDPIAVFVKAPNLPALQGIFKQQILDAPGVAAVPTITLTVDAARRLATLTFTATLTDGTPLTVTNLPVGAP